MNKKTRRTQTAVSPAKQVKTSVLFDKALSYHQNGHFSDAARNYLRLLEKTPKDIRARALLADACLLCGDAAAARDHATQALTLKPDLLALYVVLGHAENRLGDFTAAIAAYRQALQKNPDNDDALKGLIHALTQDNQLDAAREICETYIKQIPGKAAAHYLLGNILRVQQDLTAARAAYETAINLEPHHTDAHTNLARVLRKLGHAGEAHHHLELALKHNPKAVNTRHTKALLLRDQGQLQSAYGFGVETARRYPDNAEAHDILGKLAQDKAELAKAESHYRTALELDPDYAEASFDLATCLLAQGRLDEGWPLYEARRQIGVTPPLDPARDWPDARQGNWPENGVLEILPEQGLGDQLRHASIFSDLIIAAQTANCRIRIKCDPRLETLYKNSFPGADISALSKPEPAADMQAYSGSLLGRLRPSLAAFPDQPGYLKPVPHQRRHWRARLAERGKGMKIGLAWRSSDTSEGRARFYTHLADWAGLLSVANIHLVNLQYDDISGDLAAAPEFQDRLIRFSDLELKGDLENTAALMSNLDLVISAATSTADLAGALGVPAWCYLRRQHTMLLGTDHFPWYPAMRLWQINWDQDNTEIVTAMIKAMIETIAIEGAEQGAG